MERINTRHWVGLKQVHHSLFAYFPDDRACSIFTTYREVKDVNEIISRAQAMEGEAAKGGATARHDGVAGGGVCGSKPQVQGEDTLNRVGNARVAPQAEHTFSEQEDGEADASGGAGVGGADVPADDEAAHRAVMEKAFSGPAVKQGPGKKQATAPAITNEEVVAGGVAALEGEDKAAAEAESARIQSEANVARVLRADGVTPTEEAVSLFLDGKETPRGEDLAAFDKQGTAATDWLIVAQELAPYNKRVADLVKRLLGTAQYTGNLGGSLQQWARLCEASQVLLDGVGSRVLRPLYSRHSLGEVMGDAALRNRIVYRPSSQGGAGGGGGRRPKPSQRTALPALFDEMKSTFEFNDYGVMPQHCCLVIFLLLASVIQPLFADAISTLFGGDAASWCTTSVAPAKGFARALVKLYNDYSKLAEPRAQWILDALRCLLSVPNHLGMYYIVEAIGKRFGGFVQLKNPFSLPEEKRAQRGHLLLANGTVIYDTGKTIGDLVNGATADAIFAKLLSSTNHGQPQGRWTKMVEDGIAFVRRPQLAKQPAKMAVEIQFTFTAIVDGRTLMHYPYDVVRAGNATALYTNFKLPGAAGGSAEAEAATTLFSACFRGQLDRVVQFLEGGTDVNEDVSSGDGRTGLSAAAQNNHPDVVAAVIEAGADVDKAMTTDGRTPLYMAAANGLGDVVAQLVQAGADVDKAKTDTGATPLFVAAVLGHGDVVAQLVQAGADVDKAMTSTGGTPLFAAAQKGHGDVVAQLVQAGADVNTALTTDRTTPLFLAAYFGHVKVVKALLAAGADRAAPSNFGTAIGVANEQGHTAIVALLE